MPPNLADWWPELVEAGATDLGGLSANGDHISPEQPFPSPHQVRKRLRADGYALTERLCVYPQYIDPEWMEQGVLDVIKLKYWSFIPRRGSGRQEAPFAIDAGPRRRRRSSARATASALTEEELTALFAETRPEVIEEMRVAADELRAELAGDTVTFVVNRNINFTNICMVGCAFCGFGQGKRSPDAYEHSRGRTSAARVAEAVEFGATEICMQAGIHPDCTLEDYGRWLRSPRTRARAGTTCTCTPTRRWRSHTCASAPGCRRARSSSTCAMRPRLDAGHRRRGARRRRARADLARTSCRSRAGSRSSRPRTAPACARPRP